MNPAIRTARERVYETLFHGTDAELSEACAAFVAAHTDEVCSAVTADSLVPISLDDSDESPGYDANGATVEGP